MISLYRVKDITPKTANLIARWLNSPKVNKYSEQRHKPHTTYTQLLFVKECTGDYFIIRGDGFLAGTLLAYPDDNNSTVDLGILVGPNFWGQGIATQAFRLAIRRYKRHGYTKVQAGMMASNIAMQKVCLSVGMKPDGLIKDKFLLDGKREDMIVYGKDIGP